MFHHVLSQKLNSQPCPLMASANQSWADIWIFGIFISDVNPDIKIDIWQISVKVISGLIFECQISSIMVFNTLINYVNYDNVDIRLRYQI
jgi:hypothetical protein